MSAESSRRNTILIVGSNEPDITSLADALRTDNTVVVASEGVAALEIMESFQRPDIVFLNTNLPGLSSYELCRQITSAQETSAIPVIFIGDRPDAQSSAAILETGAADYICRPFSFPLVEARIKTHLLLKNQTETLSRMVDRDPLTGVATRAYFERMYDKAWQHALRGRLSLSLLMLEVDCFDTYSARYGDTQRDECLHQVALTMASCIRRTADVFARYDETKFIALLPDTSRAGAVNRAESMRHRVEQLSLKHEYSPLQIVTVNTGIVSIVPVDELLPEEVAAQGAAMLHKAKTLVRGEFWSKTGVALHGFSLTYKVTLDHACPL